jgi:hypothetical protein
LHLLHICFRPDDELAETEVLSLKAIAKAQRKNAQKSKQINVLPSLFLENATENGSNCKDFESKIANVLLLSQQKDIQILELSSNLTKLQQNFETSSSHCQLITFELNNQKVNNQINS